MQLVYCTHTSKHRVMISIDLNRGILWRIEWPNVLEEKKLIAGKYISDDFLIECHFFLHWSSRERENSMIRIDADWNNGNKYPLTMHKVVYRLIVLMLHFSLNQSTEWNTRCDAMRCTHLHLTNDSSQRASEQALHVHKFCNAFSQSHHHSNRHLQHFMQHSNSIAYTAPCLWWTETTAPVKREFAQ